MPFEYKMPDIGEGLTEGEIVKWLVAEGDTVKEDQPIVEVMTDKATVELPAPRSGKIAKILAEEGEVVEVGKVFVHIQEEGAEGETGADNGEKEASGKTKETQESQQETQGESAQKKAKEETQEKKAQKEGKEEKEEKMLFESSSPTAGGEVSSRRTKAAAVQSDGGNGRSGGRVLAAPAVRKLAREKEVDLSQVPGSGPQGRVTRDDLEQFIESGGSSVVQVRHPDAGAPEAVAVPEGREVERVPMRGVRRVISDAMARSKRTAAHFTYVEEVDCEKLVELRERSKAIAKEQHGITMTYLPFIMKATCAALKQVPIVNSAYDETAQEIVYRKYYDIGVAVATEAGLIVPVVRDADKKDMFQVQKELMDLSERTRQGKAKPDELRGSTFTITSLGKTGGVLATPVINHPEVAIMGVHEIKDKPVVRFDEDGEPYIVPGKLMNLSFSFDHRIVDGAVGADFAQRVVRYLENPELMLLEG